MATTITISTIDWGNTPSGNQTVTLEYKLWSDSSWVLIDNNVTVEPDGDILDSPLPSVSGLTENELYYVRVSNNCSSPLEYLMMSFNT